jgi:hypothetical protein
MLARSGRLPTSGGDAHERGSLHVCRAPIWQGAGDTRECARRQCLDLLSV